MTILAFIRNISVGAKGSEFIQRCWVLAGMGNHCRVFEESFFVTDNCCINQKDIRGCVVARIHKFFEKKKVNLT